MTFGEPRFAGIEVTGARTAKKGRVEIRGEKSGKRGVIEHVRSFADSLFIIRTPE